LSMYKCTYVIWILTYVLLECLLAHVRTFVCIYFICIIHCTILNLTQKNLFYLCKVMYIFCNEFIVLGPKRSNSVRKNDSSHVQAIIDTAAEPLPRDVRYIVHSRAVMI